MGQIGKTIAAAGGFTLYYGEGLLKGITPQQFARKPVVNGKTIDCNHPAWVYGHIVNYFAGLCDMTGIPKDPVVVPAAWNELFKNGTPCKDDADGKTYPSMETITRHFVDGSKYLLAKLPEVDDAIFAKPNPAGGRMAEVAPTIGAAANFLMTGHPMSHLGQVSTWRRCMGLGSAA